MKRSLSHWLDRYGMLGVLLGLCAVFSVATYSEQSAEGKEGAAQVADALKARFGDSPRVLIAVRDHPDDRVLADEIARLLPGAIVSRSIGEPKDARHALMKLAAGSQPLDAIACSQASAQWLVFSEIKIGFPALGSPEVLSPAGRKWPKFLLASNLLNVANQIAVIAIVAIGMTMVIITGGIDLSIGSLIALSAVLTSRFIRDHAGGLSASSAGMLAASAAAILVCGGIGFFSGMTITRFAVPPFIVTLAMMLVGSGVAYTLAEGQSIADVPSSFVWLGRGADLAGVPNAVVLMLALYALAHVLMTKFRIGRHIYAVGGNREAALLSGVRVGGVLVFVYSVCGLLAGLGGVVMASQLKSGSATYGAMYELYVIAAVVVGGTSLSGGQGRMFGTLTGALTIAVIQNGMNLTNVESYTQKIVLGLVILGAVLLDRARRK